MLTVALLIGVAIAVGRAIWRDPATSRWDRVQDEWDGYSLREAVERWRATHGRHT